MIRSQFLFSLAQRENTTLTKGMTSTKTSPWVFHFASQCLDFGVWELRNDHTISGHGCDPTLWHIQESTAHPHAFARTSVSSHKFCHGCNHKNNSLAQSKEFRVNAAYSRNTRRVISTQRNNFRWEMCKTKRKPQNQKKTNQPKKKKNNYLNSHEGKH